MQLCNAAQGLNLEPRREGAPDICDKHGELVQNMAASCYKAIHDNDASALMVHIHPGIQSHVHFGRVHCPCTSHDYRNVRYHRPICACKRLLVLCDVRRVCYRVGTGTHP